MPHKAQEHGLDDSGEETPDEKLDLYLYHPLQGSNNAIRLLRLRSGKRSDADVECELVEESLEDPPSYEALSWSWNNEAWDQAVRIHQRGTAYSFEVPETLVDALKALRYRRQNRLLWIDAICINQEDPDEKNRQVPMMARIYGKASSVCVWIGSGDQDSKIALDFIKNEVLRLQDFDELCENQNASPKWRAMLNVMKRPWFSRRWVVQEIALANKATIYCGKETIAWKDFSDAVQLFVEVETATHRLSEVMKKDPKFYHVPGWFEYVSALGASLLVDATGTLFRKAKDEHREALLSLEYLVSSMTVFQAKVPHDTIYSLLAIAKDTAPTAVTRSAKDSRTAAKDQLDAWAIRHMRAKPYRVDYQQPLIDVCKEFIVFCIRQSDQTRALDIICRPWAPILDKQKQRPRQSHKEPKHIQVNEEFDKMPSWIPTLAGAAHAMYEHANGELKMGRTNADPLVGIPDYTQRNYSAAQTTPVNMLALRFKKYKEHYSMFVAGFICDEVSVVERHSQGGNIPEEWISEGGWKNFDDDPPDELWRTLVADRGRLGKNPPTYYARACKESINKGLASGSLNTSELINDGRCSVIAEFFRRVQAVIWNRSLMRTKDKALGIVSKHVRHGDLICVLYGCSVPVILRRHEKSQSEIDEEDKEYQKDRLDAAIKVQGIYRKQRERRRRLDAIRRDKEEAERQEILSRLSATSNETGAASLNGPGRAQTDPTSSEIPDGEVDDDLAIQPPKRTGTGISAASFHSSKSSVSTAPSKASRPTPTPRPSSMAPQKEMSSKEKSKADQRRYWYSLVGECYVHGMMDGEAIKKQNVDQIPAQVFELR